MEDLVSEFFVKRFGMSHVNALLLIMLLLVVWKAVKYGVAALKEFADEVKKDFAKQTAALSDMTSQVKVTNKWCEMHDKEDERRFDDLRDRMSQINGKH